MTSATTLRGQKEKEGKWLASNTAPGKITSREPQDGDLQ
jgi:hypothetical protein